MALFFPKKRTAPAPAHDNNNQNVKEKQTTQQDDDQASVSTTTSSPSFGDHVHTPPHVLLHEAVIPTTRPNEVQYLTYHSNRAIRRASSNPEETAVKVSFTESDQDFPLQITHSGSRGQHRILIRDVATGQPCAVILQNTSSYRLYGTTPLGSRQAHQQPSTSLRQDNEDGQHYYLWGSVALAPGETSRRRRRDAPTASYYTLGMVHGPQYQAKRTVGVSSSRTLGHAFHHRQRQSFDVRVTTPTHSTVNMPLGATIQQLAGDGGWAVAIGPGIDPSLMLCLTAILDEIVCGL